MPGVLPERNCSCRPYKLTLHDPWDATGSGGIAMKSTGTLLVCAIVAAMSLGAAAHPMPRPREPGGHVGPYLAPYKAPVSSISGTWTPLVNQFPDTEGGPDTALLLTDGTVMMHAICSRHWWKLTPDRTGSYVNGTWTQMASMPKGYTPLYFASAVLTDGRVIVNGGEYNAGCNSDWTNLGALYDPAANKWANVTPPRGWTSIGDAQSVILPNGQYMLADSLSENEAIASIAAAPGHKVTWTATGTGKADGNDEEGWTLLPNGLVLTVDASRGHGRKTPTELYTPATGAWTFGGTAAAILVDPDAYELGAAVLRPDGTVFQLGGTPCGAATCKTHTGIYDSASGTWINGPNLPKISGDFYDVADGPAALLPDGNVLVQASPSYACGATAYCAPSHFFEFDGTKLIRISEPRTAPNISSYEGRMLVLPTGQILWSSDIGDVEVYTPKGSPVAGWAPVIVHVPAAVSRGKANYTLKGEYLNGWSQGAAYGDDAQMSTNYPLVRLTNDKNGKVCFARTHDFGGGVAVTGKTTTQFDVPKSCGTGTYALQVVTNGIASEPATVTVQ
jgi:hypothetical protein